MKKRLISRIVFPIIFPIIFPISYPIGCYFNSDNHNIEKRVKPPPPPKILEEELKLVNSMSDCISSADSVVYSGVTNRNCFGLMSEDNNYLIGGDSPYNYRNIRDFVSCEGKETKTEYKKREKCMIYDRDILSISCKQ